MSVIVCPPHDWLVEGEEEYIYMVCAICGYLPESGLYKPILGQKPSLP